MKGAGFESKGGTGSGDTSLITLVADATGTANAITATFTPAISLIDKTIVYVVTTDPNSSPTPTFSPNGATAKTIVMTGNLPLNAGSIGGSGHVIQLEYNEGLDHWELLNPVDVFGTSSGTYAAGNDSRLSDVRYVKKLVTQNQTITHTGTVAETKIFSQLIPANTFQSNDAFMFFIQCGGTSNGNTKNFKIYFNETDDLTTPTQAALFAFTTSNLTTTISRTMWFKNAINSQQLLPVNTSFASETSNSVSGPDTISVDFSQNQYFIVASTLANSADSTFIYGIRSTIFRS